MKIVILTALILAALAQNPHPLPIPGVNLTTFAGSWYVVNMYDFWDNATRASDFSCYTLTFYIDSDLRGGSIQESIIYKNQSYNDATNFEVAFYSTKWNVGYGLHWTWVALDPVSQSWGTLADDDRQAAFLLSRTTNISNVVLNAQIALLKSEGYSVNSTNFFDYSQAACPSS